MTDATPIPAPPAHTAGDEAPPPPTQGAPRGPELLEVLRLERGGRRLAAELNVSESLLRAIARRERRPSPELRGRLAALGVPEDSWPVAGAEQAAAAAEPLEAVPELEAAPLEAAPVVAVAPLVVAPELLEAPPEFLEAAPLVAPELLEAAPLEAAPLEAAPVVVVAPELLIAAPAEARKGSPSTPPGRYRSVASILDAATDLLEDLRAELEPRVGRVVEPPGTKMERTEWVEARATDRLLAEVAAKIRERRELAVRRAAAARREDEAAARAEVRGGRRTYPGHGVPRL